MAPVFDQVSLICMTQALAWSEACREAISRTYGHPEIEAEYAGYCARRAANRARLALDRLQALGHGRLDR